MNKTSIPIVFIHTGYSDYMEYSLRQAKHTNPDSEIILLGDKSNNLFPFVTYVNIKDYFEGALEFAKIYKHYSTNPYNYELFCFQRWFVLEKYMTARNIKKVFVCDTDVMIYADINISLRPFINNCNIATINRDDEHSLGISFLSSKYLSSFCTYTLKSYKCKDNLDKFKKYYIDTLKMYTVGGISDMTQVANWVKDTSIQKKINLISVINGETFDGNFALSFQIKDDNYKFKLGHKTITWENDIPYCYSYKYHKNIKFNLLHFQGPTKYLMANFYKGENFSNKFKLDIKFTFANIAAFWYRTLKIRYRFAWAFNLIFKFKK